MNAARISAPVKLGVCGLGRAFSLMLPTFGRDDRFKLVAAATPGATGRDAFVRDFGGRAYDSMEKLCADPGVDAIYIASPHQFHCKHVELAAAAGKHCLLEKPIAISLAEAQQIVDAIDRSGVRLVAGPCHSFDAPVQQALAIIESGEVGRLRQIQAMNYTDFLYRPRRPEELDTSQGGGVVFSQGIHQIDVVRALAGGVAESIYAMTGKWDPARPTEGAYSALIDFDTGVFASLTYNGYGFYDSDELMHDFSELGFSKDRATYGSARRQLSGVGASAESAFKRQRNLGFADTDEMASRMPDSHEHFGFVVASCERGDIRLYPDSLEVFGEAERRVEKLQGPDVPRQEVMDEFYEAIVEDRQTPHSARWGMASLEVALGILESAATRQVVTMQHQVRY